jgi:hypothetical protein
MRRQRYSIFRVSIFSAIGGGESDIKFVVPLGTLGQREREVGLDECS